MAKLTFDEALEALAEQRPINSNEVQARALTRRVWVAEWHIPGCLSESQSVTETKRNAIAIALEYCDHIRGARADLQRYGRTDRVPPDAYVTMAVTTVTRHTLRDIL